MKPTHQHLSAKVLSKPCYWTPSHPFSSPTWGSAPPSSITLRSSPGKNDSHGLTRRLMCFPWSRESCAEFTVLNSEICGSKLCWFFCCCYVASLQPVWPLLTDLPGITESLASLSFIWPVFKVMDLVQSGVWSRGNPKPFADYLIPISMCHKLFGWFWATYELLRGCQFIHHEWI